MGGNSRTRKSRVFWANASASKAKFGYSKDRPHERPENTYMLSYARVRNEWTTFPTKTHPLEFFISSWTPSEASILPSVEPCISQMVGDEVAKYWIDTEDKFYDMIQALKNYEEIAVDLGNSIYDHGYHGPYVALIQISTLDADYLIDCMKLAVEMIQLKQIFQNSEILKIFHDAAQDILALQFQFQIFPFPVMDTQMVYQLVHKEANVGLKKVVRKYLNVEMDKDCQLADFTMRPLPNAVMNYARADSHLLLRAWINMKEDLYPVMHKHSGEWQYLVDRTRSIMMKLKEIKQHPVAFEFYDQVPAQDYKLFSDLYSIRDNLAKHCDVKPDRIIKVNRLIEVCKKADVGLWPKSSYVDLKNMDTIAKAIIRHKLDKQQQTNVCSNPVIDEDNWEPVPCTSLSKSHEDGMDMEFHDDSGLWSEISVAVDSPLNQREVSLNEETDVLVVTVEEEELLPPSNEDIICYFCFDVGHIFGKCLLRQKSKKKTDELKQLIKANKKKRQLEYPDLFRKERERKQQKSEEKRRFKLDKFRRNFGGSNV